MAMLVLGPELISLHDIVLVSGDIMHPELKQVSPYGIIQLHPYDRLLGRSILYHFLPYLNIK